uniref:TEA domain transcription factor 3 n=1 Tax=Felis catus TaxID=9685 RepID=A0ABI8A4G5_FELCA
MLLGLGVSGPAVLPHFGRTCPCLSAGKPVRRPDIAPPSSSHSVAPYSLPQGSAGSTWDSPYPPSAPLVPLGGGWSEGGRGREQKSSVGGEACGFPSLGRGGAGLGLSSFFSHPNPGRNELIARYIKLRTGKTRTRKQAMNLDQVSKDKALQSMASMSSAQIVSASVLQNKFSPPSPLPQAVFSTSSRFWSSPPLLGQQPGPSQDIKPFAQPAYPIQPPLPPTLSTAASVPVWQDRTIASSRLRLLEYSAFMEVQRDPDTYSKHLFVHIGQTNPAFSDPPLEAVDVRQIYDKFPEKKGGLKELYEKGPPNAFFLVKFWADLNSTIQEGPGAFYGVSSQYSSADSMTISVSTKVCSFGKQVVEKVETEYARLENGRFVYRIHRSPMCEYMINFIHKLKHLPEKYMMNSVLENFTILQVVTSRDSQETLLVIAFVFEVSTSEHGAQHHVYKLVKD